MVDTTPQPATDQIFYSTDSVGNRTMSVNGQVYTVLDIGYLYGTPTISCVVLSDNTIVVSPIAAGTGICGTCLHPMGTTMVPDWSICGVPVGAFGTLIKFQAPWECHCLKMLNYQSIETSSIDPTLIFPSMCGAPKIPPPGAGGALAGLFGFGALALAANALANYSGDIPPGFDSSINVGENTFNSGECPEDPAGGVKSENIDNTNKCN